MTNSTENTPVELTDYTHRVIAAAMMLIVSLLGIIGNTLVISAVLLSRKVRTATNAFVVNLSTADLLASLVTPIRAATTLGKDGPPFGEGVCGLAAFVLNISIGCSIFTLTFIGLNRLLLITRSASTYRKFYTPKKIAVWLVLSWMFPLVIIIPSILNGRGFRYNPMYHTCGSIFSQPSSNLYTIIAVGVIYPSLLITIIVCYVLIWRHINRHAKMMVSSPEEPSESTTKDISMHMVSQSAHTISSDRTQTPASATIVGRYQLSRQQNQITKNMFYVVCAFILCLTPYSVCLLVNDSVARPYIFVLFVFNSCVNPMIYATKHRDFKTIFGCILRRQWDNIPEPSDILKTLRRVKCCGRSGQIA